MNGTTVSCCYVKIDWSLFRYYQFSLVTLSQSLYSLRKKVLGPWSSETKVTTRANEGKIDTVHNFFVLFFCVVKMFPFPFVLYSFTCTSSYSYYNLFIIMRHTWKRLSNNIGSEKLKGYIKKLATYDNSNYFLLPFLYDYMYKIYVCVL